MRLLDKVHSKHLESTLKVLYRLGVFRRLSLNVTKNIGLSSNRGGGLSSRGRTTDLAACRAGRRGIGLASLPVFCRLIQAGQGILR